MNKYARLAQEHWQFMDPDRVTALEDPMEFFSTLGRQVEDRVQELQDQLASPDQPGEQYLAKVGRLNMAGKQAEEMALAELVWLPGTTEGMGSEAEDSDPPSETDQFLWAIHRAANETSEEPSEGDRP